MLLGFHVEISKQYASNVHKLFFKKLENLQNRSVLDVRTIIRSEMSCTFHRILIWCPTTTSACFIWDYHDPLLITCFGRSFFIRVKVSFFPSIKSNKGLSVLVILAPAEVNLSKDLSYILYLKSSTFFLLFSLINIVYSYFQSSFTVPKLVFLIMIFFPLEFGISNSPSMERPLFIASKSAYPTPSYVISVCNKKKFDLFLLLFSINVYL